MPPAGDQAMHLELNGLTQITSERPSSAVAVLKPDESFLPFRQQRSRLLRCRYRRNPVVATVRNLASTIRSRDRRLPGLPLPKLSVPVRANCLVWAGFLAAAAIATALFPSAAVGRVVDRDVQTVYLRDCAVCHGADGRGTSTGPTLQGVGTANDDYQLTSGRMPLSSPSATPRRKAPTYDSATIDALVAYVAAIAPGGPAIPRVDGSAGNVAAGGALFRAQCAACHEWAGEGGVLEFGNAPPLTNATPTQIAEAVRVGPGTMPVFGEAALTDAQLNDLVAAVGNLDHPDDAGGQPLWHLGPLAEGAAALLALTVLVAAIRLMGTRT